MTRPSMPRAASRAAALTLLIVTGLLGLAPAAVAHVAVDSAGPNGDGTTTVTLAWHHGCTPDSVTTGVDVTAGAGVSFVGATTGIPGWTATVSGDAVIFTGPGVPTADEVSVDVVARIEGAPGSTIMFPTVQHCRDPQGAELQSAWTDPDPSAEYPAPSLIATAAVLAPAAPVEAAAPTGQSGADITQVLTGIVGLAAVLGAIGFATHRRTS